MRDKVIEVEDLVKEYGKLRAVDGISFSVDGGEIFAFLGPNGAGKTTTIEILQTLRKPTQGRARVLGYDVTNPSHSKEIKKRIGVLPQEFSALERLTVRECVDLFAKMYEDHEDVDRLLSILDLTDKRNVKFDELSGGLKQRVGIAAAVVGNPELIFLDEPTTGLDPRSRREVWQVIRGLKKAGRTVFLTTHYMDEAEVLADRIAIISRGKIAAIGPTSDLIEHHGGRRSVIVEGMNEGLASLIREHYPSLRVLEEGLAIDVGSLQEVAEAITLLSEHGFRKGISVRNPSIEDVFLKLIGAKLTEEGELA